jgi:hypothetical protein
MRIATNLFILLATGLTLSVLTLSMPQAMAGKPVRYDQGPVSVSPVPAEDVRTYRSMRDFQYTHELPAGVGLWDRFWIWVWIKYAELMENKGIRKGFKVLGWVVPILILLYAVLRVAGMEKAIPWVRQGGGVGITVSSEEDIRSVDFALGISEAVSGGRYREAVRLHYLQSLVKLADRGLIRWGRNKTNLDYERELSGRPELADFAGLTRIFEYACYGEMPVSADDYRKVSADFEAFDKLTAS